jgi:hypothetical protein
LELGDALYNPVELHGQERGGINNFKELIPTAAVLAGSIPDIESQSE